MTSDITILERRVSDECGCHEEDLDCLGFFVTIHHEPDKTGHIIFDFGDNGEEDFLTEECKDMGELRLKAYAIAQSFSHQAQPPTKEEA